MTRPPNLSDELLDEFTFWPAVRLNTPMIIGIAGASGSGKTYTALRLAMGLAGAQGRIAVIDTEGGRALHYADLQNSDGDPVFRFDHCRLRAPYSPQRFLLAFKAAAAAGYAVIIGDSFSDEYVGEGGLVDLANNEYEKQKTKNTAASWARPKAVHKLLMRWFRSTECHVILCLRAEEKVTLEKVDRDGRVQTVVVPIGWQPICEKTVPYELATSFLLTPDAPGVPKPIKIQDQHRAFFPLDRPVTEEAGEGLAEWCAGGAPRQPGSERRNTGSLIERWRTPFPREGQPAPDEELVARAWDVAAMGMMALKDFWGSLSQIERLSLGKSLLEDLKEHAAEADSIAFDKAEPMSESGDEEESFV